MKKRVYLIHAEQRGRTTRRTGEVTNNRNDGRNPLAALQFLLAVARHPRAATLARPRMKIHVHYTHRLTVGLFHFIGHNLLVVNGNISAGLKFQTVEPLAKRKDSLTHVVQRKIRTEFFFLQVVFLLAEFFGIVAPIPAFQFFIFAVFVHHRLQFGGLLFGHGYGRGPKLVEQGAYFGGGLGHAFFQYVGGVVFIA